MLNSGPKKLLLILSPIQFIIQKHAKCEVFIKVKMFDHISFIRNSVCNGRKKT